MNTTNFRRRWKAPRRAVIAGAVAAGLLTSMIAPAMAKETNTPIAESPFYSEQVLAKKGDNAIDPVLGANYRIPALVDLGGGVVLASYDGRPYGGDAPQPNSIVQRRSVDGGATWGEPTYVARGQMPVEGGAPKYGFSDPSYIYDEETGDVFNFFVYSKDVSFQGSSYGNDDADRNIISSAVAVSKDKGLTWSMDPANMPVLPPVDYPAGSDFADYDGPLITDVVKPVGDATNVGGVSGVFAASGEGIQLQYGPHKGRLIQQFTGKVKQPNGSAPYQAYSVYSDDHGKTWQRGEFTGTGMDENKTVELSNGDVMLNSRASSGGNGGRKVAISKDGGHSYGPVTVDTSLTDPVNNASITRMYPKAAQGSAEARMLLFSNANSTSGRQNGTIRYSCNDGATWSAGKQFKAGAMSYSTATALSDGTFGVFYEGDNNTMTFGKFNAAWLGVDCSISMTAGAISGDNGETVDADITISNDGDTPAAGAMAGFEARPGWEFGSVEVPEIQPGATVKVQVPVTIPAYAKAGNASIKATVDYKDSLYSAPVAVTITGGATVNIVGLDIVGSRTDKARDLATDPFEAGEQLPYQFVVTSLGNVPGNAVPLSGNFDPLLPPAGGNCRWNGLAVGAGYTCGSPRHAVTEAELTDGFFVPLTTWQVSGAGAETQQYTITGDEVDVLKRNPSLILAIADGEFQDVDGDGFASVGDVVSYDVTATNDGNVRLTNFSGIAQIQTADVDGAAIAVDESVLDTFEYVLEAADIATASVGGITVNASAFNGTLEATAVAEGAALNLNVKPEPSESVKPEPSESVKPEPSESVKPEASESVKPEASATESATAGGKTESNKEPLAETGFNAAAIALSGGLLLALGGLLVARSRRRARH